MSVDLHIHTTFSDGSLTPEDLIYRADSLGYRAISITDHDTVDGVDQALKLSRDTPLTVIPGIEINTEIDKHEIHILGYFIDPQNKKLCKKLQRLKQMRKKRAQDMVNRLREVGVKLDWEAIENRAEAIVSRSHIAKALIKEGYVSSWDEAFTEYIGMHCPAYLSGERLETEEAISLIKEAGGVPVLAHPGLIGDDQLVFGVIKMGIEGLEVLYYEHNKTEIKKYKKIAEESNLIITGGSDDHGPGNKDGLRLGKVRLDYSIVENLENKLKK